MLLFYCRFVSCLPLQWKYESGNCLDWRVLSAFKNVSLKTVKIGILRKILKNPFLDAKIFYFILLLCLILLQQISLQLKETSLLPFMEISIKIHQIQSPARPKCATILSPNSHYNLPRNILILNVIMAF